MAELTEGVQTVISVLGNSSTGLGTTGYAVTDDDSNALTISGSQILVTGIMSKEELKDQFGGDGDYDVIVTVKSGEIEDTWIGLSTKLWNEEVILEVNVIDKWSAVDTGNKYITGDLVRYKVVNAIRKFIKAHTNAPGGTINKWVNKTVNNDVDTSTRPVIFKAIMRTEAWMYYNPTGQGSIYGESPREGGKEELELEEENYTSYAIYDSFDDIDTVVSSVIASSFAVFNKLGTIAVLIGIGDDKMKTYTVASKTVSAVHDLTGGEYGYATVKYLSSAYGTYFIGYTSSAVYIYKDGVELQSFTYTQLGIDSARISSASISPKGTYIAVSGKRTATDTDGWVILIGS